MEKRWFERATGTNVIQRAPNRVGGQATNYIRAGWTSSGLASERANDQIARSAAADSLARSPVRLTKLNPGEAEK